MEIVPQTGRLVTKEKFGDCQLHVEWQIPKEATGAGQGRGNSGVESMGRIRNPGAGVERKPDVRGRGGRGAIYGQAGRRW